MMSHKKMVDLLHDINAIFDSVVYERTSNKYGWIDVQLAEGTEITACDFPHLLTIAEGYNVTITIYPVQSNQLAIFFKGV